MTPGGAAGPPPAGDAAGGGDPASPRRSPFPLGRTARIAVFASGRGSNLDSLVRAFPPEAGDGALGRLELVVSNRPGSAALRRAERAGLRTLALPWTEPVATAPWAREAFEAAAEEALRSGGIDLICLAGFMRILSPGFTARWSGRLVNVHPSLLPSFRGLHAQRQALRAGASESGCTVHLVDAGVDTGRILLQRRVPVRPGDTEEDLAARILREEHLAYPQAVRALLRGEVPTP